MQFWQPCQNFSQKVKKSENYYTIILFLKDLVSRHQNLLERWSASLTACWTNVCQVSESMSPKVWKHLWKRGLFERKLFPEKLFLACRIKFIQSCSKSPFFVQRPKAETKIKISLAKYVSPQKVCGHVEFLKTPSKNSPKFPKKIRIKVRKKDNKIGYVKTIVFGRNLSGRVICTFNSPAKLCRQTSTKIAGHTPKSFI